MVIKISNGTSVTAIPHMLMAIHQIIIINIEAMVLPSHGYWDAIWTEMCIYTIQTLQIIEKISFICIYKIH